MKTSFFKRAVLSLTAITSLSLSAHADVCYNFNPIASPSGFTLNSQITITGIDVVTYYGPGNFLYNIKLSYSNTVTGPGSNGRFYSYQVSFAKDNNFFQSAQSQSAIPVNTNNGTMTSYGPNTGTTSKVTGTGLYTSNAVINDIVNGLKLTVEAPGINNTSMMGTAATPAPLPVSLSRFSVTPKGQQTLLQWETLSEQNNKGFEIERSADAAAWSTVGFIASQSADGNSKEALQYSFTDHANGKKTYYRLKQLDFNGASEYSAVVSVEGNKSLKANLLIFPNPTSNQVTLSGLPADQTLVVYNNLGQVQQVSAVRTEQQATVQLAHLPNGIYYIQAGQEQFKVVLQK